MPVYRQVESNGDVATVSVKINYFSMQRTTFQRGVGNSESILRTAVMMSRKRSTALSIRLAVSQALVAPVPVQTTLISGSCPTLTLPPRILVFPFSGCRVLIQESAGN